MVKVFVTGGYIWNDSATSPELPLDWHGFYEAMQIVADGRVREQYFIDDQPRLVDGSTYSDELVLQGTDITNQTMGIKIKRLLGDDLSFDSTSHRLIGGTISGMEFLKSLNWPDQVIGGLGPIYFGRFSLTGLVISTAVFNNILETADSNYNPASIRSMMASVFAGRDDIRLGGQSDIVHGYAGADTILGNGGNDMIFGDQGNDVLYGGDGGDVLKGGAGQDILYGGNGGDRFVFERNTETGHTVASADVIMDFTQGTDKIDLRAVDAFTPTVANDAFVFLGAYPSFDNATYGEIRYEKFDNKGIDSDFTMIYFDTNSEASVDFSIKLMGLFNLQASDFLL